MSWAKFTDKLHDNDKLGAVSDAAFRLWVLSITWSNDKLTDGHIPLARPMKLLSLRNEKKTIAELIEAKLWHRASSPCRSCVKQREEKKADPLPTSGYVIHDYFEYQRPRWVIEAKRDELRALGRRGGQASRSSDTLSDDAKRDAQAPRSSVTLSVDAKQRRSSATVEPVPPYPRTPVDQSFSSRTRRGAGDPDEPAIPDEPGAHKERGVRGGLRPLMQAANRVERDARARTS